MIKLLTFLFTTIPALFSAFFALYARKWGTAIGGLAAFSAITLIFISCINAIVVYVISLAWIPTWLLIPIGMFIPGNFAAVLGAVVSGKLCRAAYDYGVKKTDMIVKAC
jgi:hypothetical protein